MSLIKKFVAVTPLMLIATLTLSENVSAMDARTFDQSLAAVLKKDQAQQVPALQDLRYRWLLDTYPDYATLLGESGYDDRWTDLTPAAERLNKRQLEKLLSACRQIERAKLSVAQLVDLELMQERIEAEYGQFYQFPGTALITSNKWGVQLYVPATLDTMPLRNSQDYENYFARLKALPDLLVAERAVMTRGLSAGITQSRITLLKVPEQVHSLIPENPLDSPLLIALTKFPNSFDDGQKSKWTERFVSLYRKNLVPAWADFAAFVEKEYLPGSRVATGMASLPDGEAFYAHQVKYYTSTDLTPEEIHQIGLAEVKRIREAMKVLIGEIGFEGGFSAFNDYLRSDPRFFFENEEELLRNYRDIAKRIDRKLPELFGTLPRLPFSIEPVPEHAEQSATTAYYRPGSIEQGRSGTYYANTYNLASRPSWEAEVLTVHEAMPGHHLQITLAQEQENLHPLRAKLWEFTAFIEGWGLYSESLGYDLGLYEDPYSEYGALTYDMWRAMRLVIDTGLHSMGWSREQAIEYFMANSAKTEHDARVEVDRYLINPGQALAYKIGQMKIKEIRARAEQELGDQFDIRQFHDALLENGAVSLSVLDTMMGAWLLEQKETLAGG